MNSNVPHLRGLVSVSCIEVIVQVKILNSVFSSIKQTHDGSFVSVVRTERLQTRSGLNSCSYNGEIVKLQSALNDNYNNFSGKTKQVPHFRAHNWKFVPNLVLQLRKETLQHFAMFCCHFQSSDRDGFLSLLSRHFSLSFFSFLILQQLVIALLIIKTNTLLGLSGYQIIITILALLSYPARPRCTQICVYPRAFMTFRVAQFSLKIAHLSFSMGPRVPRAYGLRPRLWLLFKLIKHSGSTLIQQPSGCEISKVINKMSHE